jgi:DNA polymerase-4
MSRPAEPILHVDMDAFYASVEAREDPSLRGRPLAVGWPGSRGVVMAASYEARAYGVRSAMPSARARRACPQLVFVRPNFDLYQSESRAVVGVFSEFTPLVEQLSLDEAFLDVGGSVRMFGSPVEIAERIRARVRAERALACSVGVAPNKFLAKLASQRAKPDGVLRVPADGIREFLDPLAVTDLWGVGEQTASALANLGVRTVAELHALGPGALEGAFGPAHAAHLAMVARGDDDRGVVPHEPAKQVSAEETFEKDLEARADILRELLRLADRVGIRMRDSGFVARTITIKVRFSDFKTITRSRTLPEPTDVAARLYATACELYDALGLHGSRIRLLGVAGSGLLTTGATEQLRLDERPDRWRDADRAVDDLRARFGGGTVERAAVREPRARGKRKTEGTR